MIPILYSTSETSFTSNGLGRLTDCISCQVTEERNGIFECEFKYPVTGKLYNEMVTNGGIISVTHDDAKDRQPFDIYKYSAPIDGIVTFNARHISYRLSGITVKPFTAASCALALQGIGTNSLSTNPFSFWTDKAVTSTFTLSVPTSAKAILAGQQGSILDVYGKGEYKFDKFDVKLYTNRGTNSGVTIRYGKNLSDTLVEKDNGEYYNAIVPYWKGQDGTLVTLTGWYVVQTGETLKYCIPVDFSSEFETQPTELELQTKAAAYLANNTPWLPKENVKVDFVQLWNTDEYKDVAVLERVKLCDTVAIYYPALGLTNSSAKVIKVVYDTLLERYSSIELGEPQQTLAQAIIQPYAQAIASISDKASVSFMEEAIQAATDLITGGLGGHVVINRNANGEPEEILIMDTDDTSTAVNVWRWNLNGLAHSHSGYNGPFDDIAITQDGKINASMITTGVINANLITAGTLSADRISGGTLKVGGVNNANGVLSIYGSDGIRYGEISKDGIILYDAPNRPNNISLILSSILSGYDNYQTERMRLDYMGGIISLNDANGTICATIMGDNGYIGLKDGTRNRFSVQALNGQTRWYDENGNLRIYFDSTSTSDYAEFSSEIRANDVTINGVLDVTKRRCEASLSSEGWYRVMTTTFSNQDSARGGVGFIVKLDITTSYKNVSNEVHSISLLARYNHIVFAEETSTANSLLIDKIRYTYKDNVGHVDIHYAATSANGVSCSFSIASEDYVKRNTVSVALQSVVPYPSGETELAVYTFAAITDGDITSQITFNNAYLATARRNGNIINISYQGNSIAHSEGEVVATFPAGLQPSSIHWCIGYIKGVQTVLRINPSNITIWDAQSYPSGRLYFEATYIL